MNIYLKACEPVDVMYVKYLHKMREGQGTTNHSENRELALYQLSWPGVWLPVISLSTCIAILTINGNFHGSV